MKNILKLVVGSFCLSGASVALADLPTNLLDVPTHIITRTTKATVTVPAGEEFAFGPACLTGEVVINGVAGFPPPGFTVTHISMSAGGPPNNRTGWTMGFTNNTGAPQRVELEVVAFCTRGKVTFGPTEILVFPE
jgi:hypothetical protein